MWPNYSYAYINLAIAKQYSGDAISAETNFKKGIALAPNLPDGYLFYARYLMAMNRNTEAKVAIDKGISISPQHAGLITIRQQNDAAMGNNTASVSNATEAVKQKPSAENYINLSLQYYNQGEYAKCVEAAEEALKYKPDYDLAYNNICAAYNRLGNWDKAIAAAEKGLQINPNNQLLKNNMAESKKNKSAAH